MECYTFRFLEKDEFDSCGAVLFDLMYSNMSVIAPFKNSCEQERDDWLRLYGGAFKNRAERKIVVIEECGVIKGFFGYCAAGEVFDMEEIQFSPEIQGKKGIFRSLYELVLDNLPSGLTRVEAYAHKKNEKSLGILNRLGLEIVRENEAGDCFRLEGSFDDLIGWSKNNK